MRAATLLLLLAAAGSAAAAAAAGPSPVALPVLILQLSDLHLSALGHARFGDREADLALLARGLLRRLRPAAALITGDLTDAKDARGAAAPAASEWAAYRRAVALLGEAGIAEENILDVPGNHDVFDEERGEQQVAGGLYKAHRARGAGGAPPAPGRAAARLVGDAAGACPAALLLAVDASARPGLRNPVNFCGSADGALAAEVASVVAAARAAAAARCPVGAPPPPLLVGLHYPLSTVDSPPAGLPGWALATPAGALAHAAASARSLEGRLAAALAAARASAVVSGHLHEAFGARLYRLHPLDGEAAEEGALFTSAATVASPPAGGRRFMAEWESGAWKDDRRARVLAVDGGHVSFADFYFRCPGAPPAPPRRADAAQLADPDWQAAYQRRGWGVALLGGGGAGESVAAAIEDLVLVTWPADARFGPQPALQPDAHAQGAVRALVFALDEGAADDASVEVSAYLPGGARLLHAAAAAADEGAEAGGDGGRLFEATPRAVVHCGEGVGGGGAAEAACAPPARVVALEVVVRRGGHVTARARQPAALACRAAGAGRQDCWLAPAPATPAPARRTPLERLMLYMNCPVMVHRIYLSMWVCYLVFFLALPRRLHAAGGLVRWANAAPLLRARSLSPDPPAAAGAAGAAPAARPRERLAAATAAAARRAAAAAAWPPVALVLLAGAPRAWWGLLGYAAYCLTGPLYAARLASGRPLFVAFAYGVAGRPSAAGGWRFVPTPDTLLVAGVTFLLSVAPLTLWLACVVGRRALRPARARRSPSAAALARSEGGASLAARGGDSGGDILARLDVSAPQALAFAAIVAVNWQVAWAKAWHLMGPASVLLSPGFAWAPALAAALAAAAGPPRAEAPPSRKGR
jgi:hypothetical protein